MEYNNGEGLSAFSSIDVVSQCLVDIERTKAFEEAINATVKPGDIVLDLGTGSGILSMLAARAGAKKVVTIEFDPFIGKSAYQVIKANNLTDTVEVRIADARNCFFTPETRFDVIIAEMLTTGMIDEHQVAAVNNLYDRGVVDEKTVFIPRNNKTFLTLVDFDFNTYGFSIPFIRHLWRFHDSSMRKLEPLSEEILIHDFDFSAGTISENFQFSQSIVAQGDGVINGVYFSSVTKLTDSISIKDTDALNGPVVVPVEPVEVKAGQKLALHVEYVFGGGYESVKVTIDPEI